MTHELPPRDVLEKQVVSCNDRLREFAEKAHLLQPGFIFEGVEVEKEYLGISSGTTVAGFWNHFIGGSLSIARGCLQLEGDNSALIKSAQSRCPLIIGIWMEHPNCPKAGIQRKSCEAFLAACTSFDWSVSLPLAVELADIVHDLGETYQMFEGTLPFGGIRDELRRGMKV